jgi:hypothetical protein
VISRSFGTSAADEDKGTRGPTKFHLAVKVSSSIFGWQQVSILGLPETGQMLELFHKISVEGESILTHCL